MSVLRFLLVLLFAGHAHAQSAGEISFWESVRDSQNPAELRAYLERYPNGAFVPLAQARLARLSGEKPAARSVPAPSIAASRSRTPIVGDTWTYRQTYARLRGQWQEDFMTRRPPAGHVVKVIAVEGGKIVDQVFVDGAAPIETAHTADSYLAPQGVSVFSPYLLSFKDSPGIGPVGEIAILDPPCRGEYICRASGRFAGREVVSVPAGRFDTIKVVVQEEWRAAAVGGAYTSRLGGGRTLTVWYAPEVRRAVKYSSRPTVGDLPPIETNFDLELVSYQVK